MLTQLRIRGFKGWKDTGSIRMAPITLFFGANSSGKSSIGQFLMLLKQTVESQDRKAVLFPGGKNSAIQLGSYQEMVFGRIKATPIEFKYKWTLPQEIGFTDPLNGTSYSSSEIEFEARVGMIEPEEQSVSVNFFKYKLYHDKSLQMAVSMTRKTDSKTKKKPEFKIDTEIYNLKREQGRVWYPGAPVRFYGFPDEVVAYHQNADFVQILNLAS